MRGVRNGVQAGREPMSSDAYDFEMQPEKSRSQQKREAVLRGEEMPVEFPAKTPGQVAYEAYQRVVAPQTQVETPDYRALREPLPAAWEAAAQAVIGTRDQAIRELFGKWQKATAENAGLRAALERMLAEFGGPPSDATYQTGHGPEIQEVLQQASEALKVEVGS